MHDIMPDQAPPADMPRGLHEICEDTRRAECGACPALPGDECVYTTAPVSVPATPGTPLRPVRGYHVNRFAIAEADGLISITDLAAVLETAGAFTTTTVIYDGKEEDVPSTEGRIVGEVRAILAAFDWEHDDRQLALEAIERIVAGEQSGELADPDVEGIEPYCADCGHWIGMFHGLEGWRHFRGDPAPGGKRQLYDAGHEAAPAWCEPPGRAVSPADAVTIRQALADAEAYRRERAGAYCYDCASSPMEACQDHLDDLDTADAYRDLAAELACITDSTEGGR
jgi:hypothetical protein